MGIIDDFLRKHKTHTVNFKILKPQSELLLSDEPYAINKTALAGESELSRMASSEQTDREGVWIYSKDSNNWYNLGHEHFKRKVSDGEEMGVTQYKLDWNQMGKRLVHYHIHPAVKEKSIFENELALHKKEGKTPEELEQLRKGLPYKAAVRTCTPSIKDVEAYLNEARDNSDCQIEFKIISPHGITTTRVDPTKADPKELISNYKKAHDNLTLWGYALNYCKFGDMDASIANVMQEINRRMNGSLTLEYTRNPHKTSQNDYSK